MPSAIGSLPSVWRRHSASSPNYWRGPALIDVVWCERAAREPLAHAALIHHNLGILELSRDANITLPLRLELLHRGGGDLGALQVQVVQEAEEVQLLKAGIRHGGVAQVDLQG